MKLGYISSIIACCVIFISCRRIEKLDDASMQLLQYSGAEQLVFQTASGKRDTIKLAGYETYYDVEDPGYLKRNTLIEHYNLMYLVPSPLEVGSFSKVYLVGLTARADGRQVISFNMNNQEKGYYFANSLTIDSVMRIANDTMSHNGKIVPDVLAIDNRYARPMNKQTDAPNISKLHWSISKGLVGYTLTNDEEWRIL